MSKSQNQRLIPLYILKYLSEYSNEEHHVTSNDIIKYLAKNDISAERKTIYAHIAALKDYGYDIVQNDGKNGGYFMATNVFQLPEVLLLADAVQAGKFITEKKSKELIKKLSGFISKYDAEKLNRRLYISDRARAANEKIYLVIDKIYEAINNKKQIEFNYCEWNLNKELVHKHKGKKYRVTANSLVWDDENYYLIGYDEDDKKVKYFRVDKIQNASVTDNNACPASVFAGIDPAKMSKNTFGMFGGNVRRVTLKCADYLIGVILDRFGTGVIIDKNNNGTFNITVDIAVSNQFFGWVASFAGDVSVVSPSAVKDEYAAHIKKTAKSLKN